jgi:hypothetical protein
VKTGLRLTGVNPFAADCRREDLNLHDLIGHQVPQPGVQSFHAHGGGVGVALEIGFYPRGAAIMHRSDIALV